MDISKQIAALANVIKRAKPYAHLWYNDNFQVWREEQVLPILERLKNEAISGDQTTEEGRLKSSAKIMAYQECEAVFTRVFKVWEGYEKEAKKKLKALEGEEIKA